MMVSNEAIVIGSETFLALYPLLIKLVQTTLPTQLFSRFLTYTLIALFLAKPIDIEETWGSWAAASKSIGLGTLTLSHVATSYYAFSKLPAGAAMSLFYTYPIWNMVGGVLGFGETLSWKILGLFLVASIGVMLVSLGTETTDPEEGTKKVDWPGVLSALGAALTETAMYFAVKTAPRPDPYYSILQLYPGALLGLGAWIAWTKSSLDWKPRSWAQMTLFNTLIGFIGYGLRFYAIPKVSTAVFSLLSFIGVAASFGWGWLFAKEIPTLLSGVGAGMICVAAYSASKGGKH